MTKTPFFIIASALILGGCGLPSQPTVNNNSKSAEPTKEIATSRSLKDLLALGTAQKCTYSWTEDGSTMTGEIFISGNKFKQVTQVKNQNDTVDMTAISDGQYMYTWNSKMTTSGIKMKLQSDQPLPTGSSSQSLDLDKKLDYRCTPTTISDKDMEIPKDIKFYDLSDTVKTLQQQMPDLEKLKKMIPQE